jgi:hypothetical protein
LWLENLKGRDHSEDLGIYGRIILELILGIKDRKVLTVFICFWIEANGGL